METTGILFAFVGVAYPLVMKLVMPEFERLSATPGEEAAMLALHQMGHPQDAVIAAATIFLFMAQALRFLMCFDVTGSLVLMLMRMVRNTRGIHVTYIPAIPA